MLTISAHPLSELAPQDAFVHRHIGPSADDEAIMLNAIGAASRQALMDTLVPQAIRLKKPLPLPEPLPENQALQELRTIASKNQVFKSFIGQGYYNTLVPNVILRNIYENPGWYTGYTPYQAEISQGRMEALVNFQTMVTDLTGLDIANASLLDEATAAAEAMTLAARVSKSKSTIFFVADDVLPQTLDVVQTRAKPLGITVQVGPFDMAARSGCFAALLQYPGVRGDIHDLRPVIASLHEKDALAIVAADILALTLLASPRELGADIAVGTTQRFGTPMACGGPHAGYMACKDAYKRSMPGRLVGVSQDTQGNPGLRLALQTREQHIRREKATSNICTAQALPAIMSSMYAVYHGPQGLQRIALRVANYTAILADGLKRLGLSVTNSSAFDTLTVRTDATTQVIAQRAIQAQMNLRYVNENELGISLDETTTPQDIEALWQVFAGDNAAVPTIQSYTQGLPPLIPADLQRASDYLTHPVFQGFHSETAMLRYMRYLADKDLALDRSMIPLGSCTMKLNATSEMVPITWPEFAQIHPFAPQEQRQGYTELDQLLRDWLCQITGYAAISLQPNSGAQGEYAGLLAIRGWFEAQGNSHRNICLIPESAHGTNPASAHLAGFKVVPVKCTAEGNVDLDDLQVKCKQHANELAVIMVTYPSTHGVFESGIDTLCQIVHAYGGRVYVDGANMNALVGIAAPGQFGGDVSHLNLHKTFSIPHGGGGPGVGPVCVAEDLAPYLPGQGKAGAVSGAPLGNAGVLPITWMYIRMMGFEGLRSATEVAILNANYIAARLSSYYPILYTGGKDIKGGGVAHECIVDIRPLKEKTGISAEDIAKRLIDYGFHAPTLSFPVPGTLMVEPTESEPFIELERFCEAMITIHKEIQQVADGVWPQDDNPLVNAPHTAQMIADENWSHPYPRHIAAYPVDSLRMRKYWSPVGRIDNVYGDRNLFCSCIPVTEINL
ncbi:Glycine dehydrogenase (decarboxylating) [Saezia sanguinis]|uniref:Glycine dehydrogenase (decarboxylating) n=1 Tax=Saezia sanguinis TaxID=1965230 RepID=A0A433SFC3_9BURK|nr:aminomethyl-transferring glycine dehydrogenase [Saezia sanguinis]RUS67334.1 Glycine dehydrogenase (decarboxylating) [Saezia sanguinis]